MISFKSCDYQSVLDRHHRTGSLDRVFVSGSPASFSIDTLFTDSSFTCTLTQQFHPHLVFSLIRAGNIWAGWQVDPLPERPLLFRCFLRIQGVILWHFKTKLIWTAVVLPCLCRNDYKGCHSILTEISFIQNTYLTYIKRQNRGLCASTKCFLPLLLKQKLKSLWWILVSFLSLHSYTLPLCVLV